MSGASRVILFTRAGCHLCDLAREEVARICGEAGATFSERDVDGDDEARARYSDLVPALEVDGKLASYWRIDGPALARALASGPAPGSVV